MPNTARIKKTVYEKLRHSEYHGIFFKSNLGCHGLSKVVTSSE